MSPSLSANSPSRRMMPKAEWPPKRLVLGIAGLATILVATYGSFVPFNLRSITWSEAWQYFRHAQPWGHPEFRSRSDWGANILLFIPMGFCWLGAFNLDRVKLRWKALNAGLVFVGCLFCSLAIEFSQCWFDDRVPSHNDVYAQAVGTLIGMGLWIGFGQALIDWWREQTLAGQPDDLLTSMLSVYVLGLIAYSLVPLDFITQPSEIYQKYKAGRIAPIPTWEVSREILHSHINNMIVFIPVGVWSALIRHPPRQRRAWVGCLMIGGSVAVLIELAQLFLLSRYSEITDVLTALMGVTLGALGFRWFQTRSSAIDDSRDPRPATAVNWLAAAVLYGGFLFCYFCWPLEFDHDSERIRQAWSGFFQMPLTALFWSSAFNAATQILRKLALWAVLGLLLGRAATSASLPRAIERLCILVALIASTSLGTGIELIQLLIPVHTPDSTDIALYSIGAWSGIWISLWWSRSNEPIPTRKISPGSVSRISQAG